MGFSVIIAVAASFLFELMPPSGGFIGRRWGGVRRAQEIGRLGRLDGVSWAMTMGTLMVLGEVLLLAGCRDDAEIVHEPVEIWGGRLEGLVQSYGAPRLDTRDRGLVEILRNGDCWKIYDRGRFHASCQDQEELMDRLGELRDRCRLEGFEARLVISAPAVATFREISEAVRMAAKSGI